MNIEKIKNYNQKMLALISTLGFILLLMLIILLINDLPFFRKSNPTDYPSGLISGEKIEKLNQENLRKQVISYETPWLIDTLKSVYLIPVSISTLKKPEVPELHADILSYSDTYSDFSKSYDVNYNKRYFRGSFTNLILYYALENKILSLFSERILIGSVQAYYFNDDILLVFYSAEKDTNNDGIIDLDDIRNLCVYSLKTEKLKKISDGENSVEFYQFIENTKDLLIEFSLYQYTDKQLISSLKPNKIMKYEYNSQKLTDIIPKKIQQDMQKLIEGK